MREFTGSSVTNAANAGASFNCSFPPYSRTILNFPPVRPQIQGLAGENGNIVLQVQGQAGVRYIVETATHLVSPIWLPLATNTLSVSTWNLTNSISSSVASKFWRAAWLP